MDKHHIIACARVDMLTIHVPGRVDVCSKCGYKIYISNSTPTIDGAKYICLECINWDDVTNIQRPTREQIADILKHRANSGKPKKS
jgi:hypothetical protein